MNAKEVAEALGLPPATTYRLLNLLVAEEYLVRLPDLHGFALGAKVSGLVGFAAPGRCPPPPGRCWPSCADRSGPGHLVLVAGPSVRCADVDPDLPLAAPAWVETHLHASAVGHLVLAEAGTGATWCTTPTGCPRSPAPPRPGRPSSTRAWSGSARWGGPGRSASCTRAWVPGRAGPRARRAAGRCGGGQLRARRGTGREPRRGRECAARLGPLLG